VDASTHVRGITLFSKSAWRQHGQMDVMAFAFLVVMWLSEGGFLLFCLLRSAQFLGRSGGNRAIWSMIKLVLLMFCTIVMSMALYDHGRTPWAVGVAAWPLLPVAGYCVLVAVMLTHKGRWN